MPRPRSFLKHFVNTLLFIGGCCIGYILVFYLVTVFRVRVIEVYGIPQKETATIVSFLKGQSTLFLKQKDIQDQLTLRIPALDGFSMDLFYPDRVVIHARLDSPVIYVVSDEGYFSVSENGVILEKTRATTIPSPQVYLYQVVHHNAYQAGQRIGYLVIAKAITFVQLLRSEGYLAERVDIDSVDMIACNVKGIRIIFSQSKDIALQTHEFQLIAKQMRVGALRVAKLDLRFDKPVVELIQ